MPYDMLDITDRILDLEFDQLSKIDSNITVEVSHIKVQDTCIGAYTLLSVTDMATGVITDYKAIREYDLSLFSDCTVNSMPVDQVADFNSIMEELDEMEDGFVDGPTLHNLLTHSNEIVAAGRRLMNAQEGGNGSIVQLETDLQNKIRTARSYLEYLYSRYD